nr:hypothetical protein [Tanacetum cinerariifolium]
DISSKESTLQLVYDVLRLTPFFKAFVVTADVPEIYMQEFWATAMVHHHSIQFKMDNKKYIVNLESFREMLHICPRLPGQTFDEPPFEEEILAFLQSLGHSGEIRMLTDININKLHQPWRSFAAIINKCLCRKSSGYDSLRLSQAQFLWGFYHKRNIDFAYLLWEDFVYLVEHKDTKKSNEMYYPRFTKVIIHHFMSKDPSIPRRNKVNWHYVRDGLIFTTIKLLQHELHHLRLKLVSERRRVASTPQSLLLQLLLRAQDYSLLLKKSSDEGDDGDDDEEGDDDDDAHDDDDDQENPNKDDDEEGDDDDEQEEGSDDEQASDEEYEEFIHPSLSTHDEEEKRDMESFDPIPKTPKNMDDEGNGEENLRMNVGREEGQDEENEKDKLYRDVNFNLERGVQMVDVHTTQEFKDSHVTLTLVNPDGQQQSSSVSSQFMTNMLNLTLDAGIESIFKTSSQMDVQDPTLVAPLPVYVPTLTPSTIATTTTVQHAPPPPTTAPSTLLQDLPNFGSLFGFDHQLKTLEANFSEFMQTNQFARAVSSIPEIVQRYMDQRMNKAVKVAVQIQSDRLRDKAQAKNEVFLKNIDENMQKIIKEQVKEQVKVQAVRSLLNRSLTLI